jgi:hypothetical protein
MALVFSRTNLLTAATPSIGRYLLGYDLDGVLKQKNDQGFIEPVAGSTPVGSLSQTLEIDSSTGIYSINLGDSCKIRSELGGGQLRLDNGVSGANIVNLSTDYGLLSQSFLFMNSNSITLRSLNARLLLNSTSASFQFNTGSIMTFNSTGCFINLSNSRVLFFTTGTTSTDSASKAGVIVSSSGSRLGTGANNTVILGGSNIIGATANSVYVPNIYVKDGGFIKGTTGLGQLKFTNVNETFLSSNNKLFGILSSSSSQSTYNGVFMVDTDNTFTTPSTDYGVIYVGSYNTTNNSGLSNVVVIGGNALSITQSNTTYIAGTVSIDNKYLLPVDDGTLGQVIQTDGNGNTFWGNFGGVFTEIIAASFSVLNGVFEPNVTYKILDVDTSLYGGTEIYLTTNSSGILNDTGVGKFYNPKYDQTVNGFQIHGFSSYLTNSVVFWGGKAWKRNSATYSSYPYPIDLFTLNTTYWNVIPFDDPFSNIYYNVVYDEIKYDWENDLIIYRNEKNSNIVSSSVDDTNKWLDSFGYSAIKVFQWGNVYNFSLNKGIGNNIITNSYNENINFRGSYQTNLTFDNGSYQSDLSLDSDTYQNNLKFNNSSYQTNLTLDSNSFQNNLIFDNSSYQTGTTFSNYSYQTNLTFNNSYQESLIFDNDSYQTNLTFNNDSYQTNLTFDSVSYQTNLTFNNGSYQTNLTEINGYSQNLIKLDNYFWNRSGQTMNANEQNLTLTGNKLSYKTPFGQTDKGIGEVVFFGTASTLEPGYIYQFTTGTWSKADLGTGSSASGLLAIALGQYVSDGLLLRGYATFDLTQYDTMTLGSILYLNDNGTFNQTPTISLGSIMRVIGYCVAASSSTAGTLYFCPDTYWTEVPA